MDNYNSLQEEKEPDDLLRENIIRRNKKKIAQGSGTDLPGKSMLKKSDLSLVFLGAGIITLIIFFVFLRPSGDMKEDVGDGETPPVAETVKALEQKLTTLEEMLQAMNASQAANMEGESNSAQMPDIKPYVARIERVETALSVKFDVLTARVDKLDDKLSGIVKDVEKNRKVVSEIKHITAAPPPQKTERPAVKEAEQNNQPEQPKQSASTKSASTNKTAGNSKSEAASKTSTQTRQQKTATVHHTVAKGDTLYNIGKKYDVTVDELRKMNNMTMQDAIIIGQRIIVKK
ncbi:MAG: LysM peptidoglycan-binding domain-containing protein [Desulfamplus sp.]|nr:LysM peptidoglycan-binding domain-containing protein [Desulfamplus sp.]